MPLVSPLRCLPTAISRYKYLRGSSSSIIILIKSLLIVLLLLPSSSNGFTSPYSPKPKQRRYKYDNLILNSYENNNVSNSREELWNMRYQELVEYKKEHGNTLVPRTYADNRQLGIWVNTQRKSKKKYKLAPERMTKLNEIGFVWDPLEGSWIEMFQQIVDYKDKHGDTLVLQNYPDNPQLGIWVDAQRQSRKNKKLAPERVDKLNGVGFVWEPLEVAWGEMLQQLKQYKKEHGDTLVPRGYADYPHLGNWVNWQRVRYNRRQKGQASQMTDERVDKLNEIGFVWDANEATWEEMFQHLNQYKKDHGDTLVPQKYPDNPQLGKWVNTQRHNEKNNSLTQERVDKLNEVGFVWDTLEDSWNEMFQQIVAYKDNHGDTLVPTNYPDDQQLGKWVNTQRRNEKNNSLTQERVDKLNEIGFVWDPLEYSWNEMFQQIVAYKDNHGDTLVPAKYPDNPQLGKWVNTQRHNEKNNSLTQERVDKLNEVGFVWDPLEDSWNEMFQQVVEYKDKHGDTLVPTNYPDNRQLAIWVTTQRCQYKLKQSGEASQMTDERVDKLNEIGFVWDVLEAAWEEMFQQLMKYKEEHGDTLVPAEYPDNPQLGIWVFTQRQNRKKKNLAPARVDKLNDISFVWEPLEAAWHSKYNKLNTFYKRYGHTRIPMGGEEDEELYSWCMRQRYSKAKGRLKGHRYNDLKKINFDFFVREIAKRSSLIENMIIYELERMGHEFDMLNQVFFGVRLFPDGVIFVNEVFAIFLEVDEKYHSCRSSYPIKRELGRMNTLRKEATTQGYAQVIFVRIGTGDQRKVVESQVEFVSKHLHELKSNVQPNRYSVHYIDYPHDHHHVIASKDKQHFDEVKVFTSN